MMEKLPLYTSSFNMKKFLRKVLLVLSPFLLIAFYLFILYLNFNLHKIDNMHERKDDFILGEPFTDPLARHVKLTRNLDSVTLITIGSSRVLQFTQDMYEEKFYNLGYTTSSVFQIHKLIKTKNIHDKTLIIALDQWCFNSNWPSCHDTIPLKNEFNTFQLIYNSKKIGNAFTGKIYPNPKIFDDLQLIGSGANMALSGIRNDGSHYYGKKIHGLLNGDKKLIGEDYHFENTLKRIKKGKDRFEYGDLADTVVLNELARLIETNKNLNNRLIFFFPPFSPTVNAAMKTSGKYNYMTESVRRVKSICDSAGVIFYDFTAFPSTDMEYVDGFHGGKQVYYRIAQSFSTLRTRQLTFNNPFESTQDTLYSRCRKIFFSGQIP